jgi:hypothetical protein
VKTSLKFRSFSKRAKWTIYPTMALAMINFFAFVEVSIYLGGDALNGYVQNGHHFLCENGRCTEVSSSLWRYSWWHAVTAMGGILVVFAETAFFLNTGDIDFE